MKISVVINTFNAGEFLERTLESVKDFDEIVICDMYSDDRTVEIAQKYNCKIIYHERTGIVEPARAYAISSATYNWVLVVDADEVIPKELKDFLYTFPKSYPEATALRIPRKNYFMGRFMKCAYPDYILRFFEKDKVIWPTVIHSQPKIDGSTITIPKNKKDLAFIHLANEPIRVTVEKMNKYTEFELERRKNRNYNCFSLIFETILRFLRFYLFKGGFRDGLPGFIWAYMYSYYKFITIAKVMESKIKKEGIDKDLRQ